MRGVLNAVNNFVLTRMDGGDSYDEAFAAAQDAGLAERDPTADTEGLDASAKAMVLAALVLGVQLRREDVRRRGIADIDREQVAEARAQGRRIKEVVTVDRSGEDTSVTAGVEPTSLPADDPLARVDGTTNILTCTAEPVGEISITGPGAGPRLAGQGVLSDVIAATRGGNEVAASRAPTRRPRRCRIPVARSSTRR